MGPKKVEKSEEKVKSVGIITIKTTRETVPYTVKGKRVETMFKVWELLVACLFKIQIILVMFSLKYIICKNYNSFPYI